MACYLIVVRIVANRCCFLAPYCRDVDHGFSNEKLQIYVTLGVKEWQSQYTSRKEMVGFIGAAGNARKAEDSYDRLCTRMLSWYLALCRLGLVFQSRNAPGFVNTINEKPWQVNGEAGD
jgi:hypothetical protein